VAALAALAAPVAACFPVTIDEQRVFFPPPRPQKAQSLEDLDRLWLANARATNWATPLEILTPRAGAVRLVPRDPAARFVPFEVVHGFTGAGAQRLAFSHFTALARDGSGSTGAQLAGARRPLLVVTCGGNATDRYTSGVSYAQKALAWGDVLSFDYPGYGDSAGAPSTASFEAATELVRTLAQDKAAGRPILFWGHSLGGFVCTRLAAATPGTVGLIIETSARRAEDVARAWTPGWARLVARPSIAPGLASYDNATEAARATVPVLVLGAAQDDTLPVELAQGLAQALEAEGVPVTYHEFPDAEHWNVPNQPGFADVVGRFIASLPVPPP
jgi:pimeloyl-ACP methyl ester carboxylesterase